MAKEDTAVAARVEQTPLTLIESAVQSGTSPEALSQLMDLQERWESKQAKIAFDSAVAAFQRDCPPIIKSKSVNLGGGGYQYAPYEDIMHTIGPALANNGLSLSFDSAFQESMLTVTCFVSGHGHTRDTSVTLPLPGQMRVNDTQKAGAGLSYGKRYAVINALNLSVVGEDSDAARLFDEAITDQQFSILNVMLDAAEDQKEGTKARFEAFLKQATGTVVLRDLPAKHYNMVHDRLRAKLSEVSE